MGSDFCGVVEAALLFFGRGLEASFFGWAVFGLVDVVDGLAEGEED